MNMTPHSRPCDEESALLDSVEGRLTLARRWLEPLPNGKTSHLFAQRAVAMLRRYTPAARLTVKVDVGGVPTYMAEALRRASAAAVEAWNGSLRNVIEFHREEPTGVSDVLVRAWDRPIYGATVGVTLYTDVAR